MRLISFFELFLELPHPFLPPSLTPVSIFLPSQSTPGPANKKKKEMETCVFDNL